MKKRILALLMSMVMLIGLLPGAALAAEGSGTPDDPYVVSSDTELVEAIGKGGCIKLANDIALTGWTTVPSFSGTLDGDGNTISGLNAPLFKNLTDATIKNLTIVANINTTASDAAAIALLTGGTTNITDVTVKGTISGGTDVDNNLSKNGGAGGFIVRAAGNLTIDNCVNEAAVTGVDRKAAGFVSSNGTAAAGDVITIRNSVNKGTITANRSNTTTNAYEVYAAGFMAWNGAKDITVNIENCTNNGTITGVREATVEGYSTVAAGGIIATCWNGAGIVTTLTDVVNTGNVTATNNAPDHNAYAAGVIGLTNPSSNTIVKSATVSGTIKAVVSNNVGYATVGGITAQTNNSASKLTVESADVSAATYVAEGGSAQYKGAVVGHHGGDDTSLTYDVEKITAPAGMKPIGDDPVVAQIGTKFYETLAAAVADATDKSTISLLDDMADIGSITLPVGVTIDGNGYTISGNSSFTVAKSSTTVIKNVKFEDIIDPGSTSLSAIYATGLTAEAHVTITGCYFDNMEWEAIQVTSSVDGATVIITDNEFWHTATDTDEFPTSERHIHVQPGIEGYAMNLTITRNKLYDCDKVKAAIGVYYITESGSINMGGNYVRDVSNTDEGVSTIAVMLAGGDDGFYNGNELVLPLMDENLENEVVYSFLAHGTGGNSWKGTFHKTFEDAAAAAADEIVDTVTLVADITVDDELVISLDDGVTFDQNGKTITLNDGGAITSTFELEITAGEGCELVHDPNGGYTAKLMQYTVTFVIDDETDDSTVTVDHGATVGKPDDPSKEGYIFDGWYDGDTEYDFDTPVTGDITLTAKWTADSQGTSDDGEDPTPSDEPTPSTEPSDEPEPTDEPSDEPTTDPSPSTGNTPRSNTGTSGESESSTDETEPVATAVENEDGSISVTIPEGTETVTLPVDAQTAPSDGETGTTIDIDLPEGESVKIEIPVSEPRAGAVVVIVNEDGTEEVVADSIPTENGITFTASGDVTVKVVDRSSDFVDVPEDAWYADAVDFAVARGIFDPEGTGENKFEPEKNVTRAMVFTMLARYAGVDTEGGATWYEKSMAWAVENGISDGTNPDRNVTREQLVTMLFRYAQLIEADVSVGEETEIPGYGDALSVSEWAMPAMQWACGADIIKGYPDGTLRPGSFATRAEIAVILQRFIEFMSR